MKKAILITVPLISTILFSGCATLISGKTQKINVTSYPSHKEVTIGSQSVITPSIITVERSKKDLVVKSKDCDKQKLLSSRINPVFFVNLLSGNVFGSTTDYMTGSMWEYDDNVHLECPK
jgi:uncharacterized protein YceK